MLNTEVVVLKVDVEIRQNQAIFDELPHNASHFIAIEFDYGIKNLDFCGHEGLQLVDPNATGTYIRLLENTPTTVATLAWHSFDGVSTRR